MRLAKFNDGWRRTQDLSNYDCQLREVSISDAEGISDKFCLELNNGISVICGKNGVGKSTILRSIYSSIRKDSAYNSRLDSSCISISLFKEDVKIEVTEQVNVSYLEPSVECNKIITFLNSSENIEDFIEGLEPNGVLGKKENVNIISNIIGRNYSEVEIYEVEGALGDDYTFPFIRVTLPGGGKYTCLDMGSGEYLCMYIFWFINWIEKHSILLIDEIENCISIYSQEYLMDYLAYISSQRGIWTLLSSHSEAILNKVGINNARLISNIHNSGISVVSPKHERKYFTALGIKPKKKGVFIVEDKFSSFFLNCIFNRAASDIAYDYHIVSFKDGESDIEKIVKHFNPNKDIGFGFFAVFDADMRAKINKIAGRVVPVIALPSIEGLNPEEELWRLLTDKLTSVAEILGVLGEELLQYHEICNSLDHHDRFMSLAGYLNISEEVLFNSIFSVWYANNIELVKKFVFSVIVSISNLNNEEINALASDMGLAPLDLQKSPPSERLVFFDGKELSIR